MKKSASILLCLSILASGIYLWAIQTTEVDAKVLLENSNQALSAINYEEGDLVYVRSVEQSRVPPASLEPFDPYHLSFAEMWPKEVVHEHWAELGKDMQVVRWRTKSYENGNLTQDLMFEDGLETDYFLDSNVVTQYETNSYQFRDNMQALVEDYLQKSGLEKKDAIGPDGNPVLSIYTPPQNIEGFMTVEDALASHQHPFFSDIEPVQMLQRVDFDPVSLFPYGVAQIVRDRENHDHIVRYSFVSPVQILDKSEAENIFDHEVPDNAKKGFNETSQLSLVTSQSEVFDIVPYDLYGLNTNSWELKDISLQTSPSTYPYQQLKNIAPQITFQSIQDNQIVTTLFQGPKDIMTSGLSQVPATWYKSERFESDACNETNEGWVMEGMQDDQWTVIIECHSSLLHFTFHNSSREQALEAILNLEQIEK